MSRNSVTGTYDRGYLWHSKGMSWMFVVFGFGALTVLALPINIAIADPFWSWIISGLGLAALAVELAALARMIFCFRRARTIWRGIR